MGRVLSAEEANRLTEFDYSAEWRSSVCDSVKEIWPLKAREQGASVPGPEEDRQPGQKENKQPLTEWNTYGMKCGIRTLDRDPSVKNFIRILMLADGFSFEALFAKSPDMVETYRHYTERAVELLEAGKDLDRPKEPEPKEDSAQEGSRVMSEEQRAREERIRNEWKDFRKRQEPIVQNFAEIYHKAGVQLLKTKLPTLEIEDLNAPTPSARENVNRAFAMADLLKDYQQSMNGIVTEYFEKGYPDSDLITNSREVAEKYCESISGVGLARVISLEKELASPQKDKIAMGVAGKLYLEKSGKKFAGMTLEETILTGVPLINESALYNAAVLTKTDVVSSLDDDSLKDKRKLNMEYLWDRVDGMKQYSGYGTYVGEKYGFPVLKAYIRPSEDVQQIDMKLSQYMEAYQSDRKASILDELAGRFKDNVNEHAEEELKRFYIDGKNAYELFSEQCGNDENKIKEQIVDSIVSGKQRVEFVRLETSPEGELSPVVLPVKADLSILDQGKKWYQSSIAKEANSLWSKDSGADKRRGEIIADVTRRQEKHLRHVFGIDQGFQDIMGEINHSSQGILKTFENAAETEGKLAKDPEVVRKWLTLREKRIQAMSGRDGLGQSAGMEPEEQAELEQLDMRFLGCSLKENSSKEERAEYLRADRELAYVRAMKLQEANAAHEGLCRVGGAAQLQKPEELRAQLRMVNKVYEHMKVTQDDMRSYRDSLRPEERERALRLELWVRQTVLEGDRDPVTEAPDQMDVLEALAEYSNHFRKAILHNSGYVDCMRGDFYQRLDRMNEVLLEYEEPQAERANVPHEARAEGANVAREEDAGLAASREEPQAERADGQRRRLSVGQLESRNGTGSPAREHRSREPQQEAAKRFENARRM